MKEGYKQYSQREAEKKAKKSQSHELPRKISEQKDSQPENETVDELTVLDEKALLQQCYTNKPYTGKQSIRKLEAEDVAAEKKKQTVVEQVMIDQLSPSHGSHVGTEGQRAGSSSKAMEVEHQVGHQLAGPVEGQQPTVPHPRKPPCPSSAAATVLLPLLPPRASSLQPGREDWCPQLPHHQLLRQPGLPGPLLPHAMLLCQQRCCPRGPAQPYQPYRQQAHPGSSSLAGPAAALAPPQNHWRRQLDPNSRCCCCCSC
ncbi:UNVERIFIED_CONTAM: hypothetical protein K2H54_070179 [Gekko kuhli]